VNPDGGAGWDEPPLDIQIPDDARELDRDVLAYHRELRAKRRRSRVRRLAGPLTGHGTLMPLLASILAVCLVAGAMLSVATFSPATSPADRTHPPTTAPSSSSPVTPRTSPAPATQTTTAQSATSQPPSATPSVSQKAPTPHASVSPRTARSAGPSPAATRPAPSGRGSSPGSP
jgi:cytoskeletal protein RodZ